MKTDTLLPKKHFFDQYFVYDKDSGILTWKRRPRAFFKNNRAYITWNKRFSGMPAGAVLKGKNGYERKVINVDGKRFLYHRVCLIMYGYTPEELRGKVVDHINRNAADNRIKNLRVVDETENARNRARRHDNKSGVNGVGYCAINKNWYCSIGVGRKYVRHTFDNKFDAVCKRKSLELEIGYSPNHGDSNQALDK